MDGLFQEGHVEWVEDPGKLEFEAAVGEWASDEGEVGERESEAKEETPGMKEEDQGRRCCRNQECAELPQGGNEAKQLRSWKQLNIPSGSDR